MQNWNAFSIGRVSVWVFGWVPLLSIVRIRNLYRDAVLCADEAPLLSRSARAWMGGERLGRGEEDMLVQAMNTAQPPVRLQAARPLAGRVLSLTWEDGIYEDVDITAILCNHRSYATLRHDDALFRSVRVTADGTGIQWSNGCRVAASIIRRMPKTQMDGEELRAIMDELRLTVEGLSAIMGLSRRVIGDYRSGAPIPKTLALAMRHLQDRGGV